MAKNLHSFYDSLESPEEDLSFDLQRVRTEQEATDWMIHLKRLVCPDGQEGGGGASRATRNRSRLNPVVLFKRYGINDLAGQFGISAGELGKNVRDSYQGVVPMSPSEPPTDLAQRFIDEYVEKYHQAKELEDSSVLPLPQTLQSPEDVLKACRTYLSYCISSEFHVRQRARELWNNFAFISTTPTKSGMKAIDVFSPYAQIKKLVRKPVKDMGATQYLWIMKAEEAGFVEVTIDVSSSDYEGEFLGEFKKFYCSDKTSHLEMLWNEEREKVLGMTLKRWLFTQFRQESRFNLKEKGLEAVAFDYFLRFFSFSFSSLLYSTLLLFVSF